MARSLERRCSILHIDDNVADSLLLADALGDFDCLSFTGVQTFDEALALLANQHEGPKVNLILLDWNLVKTTGRAVLTSLKSNDDLKAIPVIVMTGSLDPRVVLEAYNGFASCVLQKPNTLEELTELAARINQFWLETASLPPIFPRSSKAGA